MADYSGLAKENLILKVRVGSHLFGTNTPESDLDYEGIFMPDKSLVFGFGRCREVDLGITSKDETGRNTSDAVDYKIREYRDFYLLALENNPNIMNILFANDENVMFQGWYGASLRAKKMLFPHAACIRRFKGYAMSQLKKMDVKPGNYRHLKEAEKLLSRKDPKDILVNAIHGIGIPFEDQGPGKHIKIGDIFLERSIQVKKAMRTIADRINRVGSRVEMWEEFGFDCKFASNLIQMLLEGVEIVSTGGLKFPMERADLILDVKRGKYSRDEIIEMSRGLEADIDKAAEKTPLPSKPRYTEIHEFVMNEVEYWISEKY
jgi:hypothetical protein